MPLPRIAAMVAALALWASVSSAQVGTMPDELDVASNIGALENAGHRVKQISAGRLHTCALLRSGNVYCWGRNTLGQLGNGTLDGSSVPVKVRGLENISQIALGASHSCAIRNDGDVFCWGSNDFGQVGDGTFENKAMPVRIDAVPSAIQISTRAFHTCMVARNGEAFCWGWNLSDQLGTSGSNTSQSTPARVKTSRRFTQVSAGEQHTCALDRNARAFCWGRNIFGQLGTGSFSLSEKEPQRVVNLRRLTKISSGGDFTCGLRDDGVVFCWGRNGNGELGNGTFDGTLLRTRVKRLFDVADLTTGFRFACAAREGGGSVCWGSNLSGQLGNGSTRLSTFRKEVKRLRNVVQISAGASHVCAVKKNGKAFCWGANNEGQLGNGETTLDPTPIRSQVIFPAP